MSKVVTIVGGHGKVGLRLSRLLKSTARVTSIIHIPEHAPEVKAAGAIPIILSLESDPVEQFSAVFAGSDVVVFSAGAGGKGGPERTKAVDYEGAVKVFDAIEAIKGEKPRLLLVSAIDARDRNKIPHYYNEEDVRVSDAFWKTLSTYMTWKYEAEKDLHKRTAFKWTVLRASELLETPGTGKASIGMTHITPGISRDDVAKTLALLVDRPDADGLSLDIIGGETSIDEALDSAIRNRVTSWSG
ncbi:unnamed protein product [Somion occarium]|uniref:NAD(P)-binding domain-containing protein n=1 Tax=Somion occarium TaxID=3059160 RepID=A0ABP1DRA0_9APHY